MPIYVNCVCGKRLQGRDEDVGRQTRCPYCGQIITLPTASDPEPVAPLPAPVPPPEAKPATSFREYTCRVCHDIFRSFEVYSEDGSHICKRCFEREEGVPPSKARDRWDHIRIPGQPRSTRRRSDEDEDEAVIRRPSHARHVYSYLTEAILVTLFCCLPFGIVAIVKASEVNTCLARGDDYGATAASESAKVWCGVSFGLGIAGGVIFLLIAAAGGH